MGSFGGFYKGDKKKPKANKQTKDIGGAPVLVMPELIAKKKPA